MLIIIGIKEYYVDNGNQVFTSRGKVVKSKKVIKQALTIAMNARKAKQFRM